MKKHSDAEIAARVRALAARDPLGRVLGVEFVDGGPGRATVRMQVRAEHLNFNGSCHGGTVFVLADTAFGLASNSYGTVAASIDSHITYHAPVMPGDRLTATATEVSRTRRLAVYRVDVVRDDGTLTSAFTGTVYLSQRSTDTAG